MKIAKSIIYASLFVIFFCISSCNAPYEAPEGVEIKATHEYVSLSIYKSNIEFGASGGTEKFDISSNGNKWTMSEPPEWLTAVLHGSSWDVELTAAPNSEASERHAVLTYTTAGFFSRLQHIKQAGAEPYFKVKDDNFRFSSLSDVRSFDFETNVPVSEIVMQIAYNSSWLSASLEYGKLIIIVEDNNSKERRQDTIWIKYGSRILASCNIYQEGISASSDIRWIDADAKGEKFNLDVKSNTEWYVYLDTSVSSWVQTDSDPHTGDDTVSLEVLPNNSTSSRRGYVYICSTYKDNNNGAVLATISISQAGLTFNVGEPVGKINAAGTNSISVNVQSNAEWEVADITQTWLSASPMKGSDNGTVVFKATTNLDYSKRTAKATIRIPGTTLSKTIDIEQEGKAQGVGETMIEMPWKATSRQISMNIEGSWQISRSETWVHVDRESGTGSGKLTISVDRNDGTTDRTTYVIVTTLSKSYQITVKQQCQYFTMESLTGTVTAKGGKIELSVASSIGSKAEMWTSADNHTAPGWVAIAKGSGNNYTISAAVNPSGQPRTAVAAFTPTDNEAKDALKQGLLFNIVQEGRRLSANVTKINVSKNGGTTQNYQVVADGKISIEKDAANDYWYSLTLSNDTTFKLIVSPNTRDEERVGTITVRLLETPVGENAVLTIPVHQYGAGVGFDLGGYGDDEDWTIKAYK